MVVVMVLLATACASASPVTDPPATAGSSDPVESSAAAPSSTAPSANPPTSSTSTPAATADTGDDARKPPPEGPAALDFTTVLASGESFTLFEAVKPVYIVFWAEW